MPILFSTEPESDLLHRRYDSTVTNSSSLRAINGILAMSEFKEQFGAHCRDIHGNPEICTKDSSIIVAILSVGTVVGALISAPVGDALGRRIALLLSVAIFAIGAIIQVCAEDIAMLLVGRYVCPRTGCISKTG